MTDARWSEVEGDLAAACRHFDFAARPFDAGGFEVAGLDGYRARMGFQHAMHAAHTSLEGALVRILEILGEEVPVGRSWHGDLLKRASKPLRIARHDRPAILTPDVARDAAETRRFRHRADRDHDSFIPERSPPSVEAARRLARTLGPCIDAVRERIDPPEAPRPG
ncbi:hypothetical protein [Methylobacterium oxalidis]|uniref:HepT-like domain-containing protein n=1 Tax=Methylobacterium oxalidis TaxID=944322 RepID=A0A512J7X1_9HYPH|nr:hypothetical protein [Methylobacterium oxalidis]GEP05969.1 hypothetical protein MOX02_40070 [Methylobacterium oxalidis]GJE33909.1 hypothetical protein LDDCCGHA_4113 [Methylobacterium oxalidis]GLS66962.1 hypothetical protein GCM10007888_53450 [Methylobacterium oxalidis]